ncbi:MAG: molybdopterin-guanine dinucleotide biosynthesis protein B [Gemmatimonadaceae bacterium]
MVTIVGRKHSGKTTLVVRLVAELVRRGHRVMTIKHGSHTFNLDPATTDTYRHYHEGNADKVAMVAPDKFALIERWSDELSPEAVAARHMADADLVVCEGFTRSSLPKIEIYRREAHGSPVWQADTERAGTWLAIVTDVHDFRAPVPIFRLSDARWLDDLAAFVERELMSPT